MFRDTAQAEAAQHEHGSVVDIGNGFLCRGNNFIHTNFVWHEGTKKRENCLVGDFYPFENLALSMLNQVEKVNASWPIFGVYLHLVQR